MSRAMTFLRQKLPPGSMIVVDYQSSLLLGHYLCEQQPISFDRSIPGFLVFRCGGYRVLSTGPEAPIFTAESFLHGRTWSVMPELNMKAGDRFWVVQAGWDIDLGSQLRTAGSAIPRSQGRVVRTEYSDVPNASGGGRPGSERFLQSWCAGRCFLARAIMARTDGPYLWHETRAV